MTGGLYDHPEYYDVAFSWDISTEVELLRELFDRHAGLEVGSVLEPACGTGRFLVGLPAWGYRVTGYDIRPEMVAYARRRIVEAGLEDMAAAEVADMRTAAFDRQFDAAINSINSLGYLLSDEDIVAHFRATADSLKSGGVYVVQLACAWDRVDGDQGDGWTIERQGIRIKTTWRIEREDREGKLSHQLCRMEIDRAGQRTVLEDRHVLRLWLAEDLEGLIDQSASLRLEAIYDEKRRAISPDARITGEMGNLFWVLKR